MSIEGVNNVQPVQMQAPQMPQASQSKVIETEAATKDRVVAEPIRINTEDPETTNINKDNTKDVSSEQIKKTLAEINKRMMNTACQYGIHEGTGRVTIKIVDKETRDVIKEIPAEETLELIAKAWELAGIMVDKRL
ncbi:MAG: flagellar protein FlaG [Lachnospiraceae bacterium]|nr:flagellar protein FlaG [Lachnospiraceae bacterium]